MDEALLQLHINSLSPGDLQRLAEAYAELTWPDRYRCLVPQGRNAENATTTGWPDAWAADDQGQVHAVEATRDLDWGRHLDEDLQKAKALPGGRRLASFVFVSRRDPRPADDKLKPYRAAFLALGLTPDRVHFIFMDTLRRALNEPPFARVRAQLLGLPTTAFPLVSIENARNVYGDGGAGAFRPTREEYLSGRVHRNSCYPVVKDRLRSDGWVLLRGRGASGKTAMSTALAHEHAARMLPAWYLDLTGLDDLAIGEADERMHLHGGEGVLFIVDNVHIAPVQAGHIYDQWAKRRDGSLLLLAGRETSPDPYSGYGSTLFDLEEDAVDIAPDSNDLGGIYRRLAERETSAPPSPPAHAYRRWLRLFAGDLVAFSSAIVQRGPLELADDWKLNPSDAVRYVQSAYLADARGEARKALLRVAALSAVETPCPESAADPSLLRSFIEAGLILRTGLPSSVQTVHPGVGRLILAAAGYDDSQVELFEEVASIDPRTAARAAQRMPAARGIPLWKSIIDRDPATLIETGLRSFAWTAGKLVDGHHFTATELDELCSSQVDSWAAAAQDASARDLGATLGMTSRRLPATFGTLKSQLQAADRPIDWLVDRISAERDWPGTGYLARQTSRVWPEMAQALDSELSASLGSRLANVLLAGGLSDSAGKALRAFMDAWPACGQATIEHLDTAPGDRWATAVRRASLNDLKRAQGVLRGTAAERRLLDAIEDPTFVSTAVNRCLDRAPQRLRATLRDISRLSPAAYAEAHRLVALTESGGRWAAAAFDSDLRLLPEALGPLRIAGFSDAVFEHLERLDDRALGALLLATRPAVVAVITRPPGRLAERIGALLGEPAISARYVSIVLSSPPQEAGRFFSASWASGPTAALIASDALAASPVQQSLPDQPWALPSLVSGLGRVGRADLARQLALAFGDSVLSGDIPPTAVGLTSVSHVLRLQASGPEDWCEEFIDAVWGTDWITSQMTGCRTHDVAQALFSIWHYGPRAAARVPAADLANVAREALDLAVTVGPLYEAVRLAGSAALYSVPEWAFDRNRSIGSDVLEAMVGGLVAMTGPLSPAEAQMWLGFAAIADRNEVELPLAGAEAVIGRLREQQLVTKRHRQTADRISSWLAARLGGSGSVDTASR